MTALSDFLREQTRNGDPWNCSTFPADWCIALGHPDFAARWRGVTDPAECEAAASEGLVALWDDGIGDALPVVEGPFEAGDIAVVHRLELEAGAVFTGERWAIKSAEGLSFLPMPARSVLKAWRP